MIQGDISELTVDCVVHPTNASFNLTGLCGKCENEERRGKERRGGREGGEERRGEEGGRRGEGEERREERRGRGEERERREKRRGEEGGRKMREEVVYLVPCFSPAAPGTALREAGGTSFEQAVKEVADKQSLSVGEGKQWEV